MPILNHPQPTNLPTKSHASSTPTPDLFNGAAGPIEVQGIAEAMGLGGGSLKLMMEVDVDDV
jgi:hypothetical protein